jgi:two-component system, chemotaxis family, protein-glutamate methylesterase/glutaminase
MYLAFPPSGGGRVACGRKEPSISARAHDIVAIGASAGGFTAFQVVLADLPSDLAAAVLIVQHLEPDRESRLPALLGRRTALPVSSAVDGTPILAGHVYVAVPGLHLVTRGDQLALVDSAPVRFSRPSIDVLFASIAASYGPRSVGVVLTGSGSDGTDGVRAIHAAGGMTIAQDAREAAHASMPAHAYATGCIDLSLPLHDIAPAIVQFVKGTQAAGRDRA